VKTPAKLPGRNEPCYCGSGRKYKQCHLDKDEAAARAARAKEAEAAPVPAAAEGDSQAAPPPARSSQRPTAQPWKRTQNTRGFHKVTTPRKVGGG
jgi:hypothetical protein